ncbi:MAG: 5-methyltetrahydrofolate--homocysteine methyltransferase [FCB group bacterium]|nr:5-methyltetrahydrofolate--homocysteine methyltransferase [FCB group bacterium]
MTFREALNAGHILVGDGAMGTELEKRKQSSEPCPEMLSIVEPEVVRSIHRDYFSAGADLVETNTFGANRARLALYGREDQIRTIIQSGVSLAREVRPEGKYVLGSVGPTGELPEPYGDLSHEQGVGIFSEAISALIEFGVDGILIETMMSLEEAAMAVEAARQVTELPVVLSMTFEVKNNIVATGFGVKPSDLVQSAIHWELDGVGANCGHGFDSMVQVVHELTGKLPVLAQANAGLPVLDGKTIVYPDQPETVRADLEKILDERITILGGCCGTNPEHIILFRSLVDEKRNNG